MRRLCLLLLLILIESTCTARSPCGKTKKGCQKLGGECQLLKSPCFGTIKEGKKYCRKHKKCGCCIPPPDCPKETLPPCRALNGTCMSQDEECPQGHREVINEAFCNFPDTCKCCFPGCGCDPDTCTYKNILGKCLPKQPDGAVNVGTQECKNGCQCYIDNNDCENNRKCDRPEAEAEGYYPTGHCRKRCHDDEGAYNKCDINNQDSCYCCLRKKDDPPCDPPVCETENGVLGNCSRVPIKGYKYAGQMQCKDHCGCWIPGCRSIGDRCRGKGSFCIDPEKTCPNGFHESSDCFKPIINENGEWIQSQLCKCCKPRQVDCENKYDCGDELDYCVDKQSNDCPNNSQYAILSNACFKTSYQEFTSNIELHFISLDISLKHWDCDCCKSLECRSIKDRCKGKGEFCIDPETTKSCPVGYSESYDCYKPVIENGQIVASRKCICCKPQEIDCGPVCLSANLSTCVCMLPGIPCKDEHCYYDDGNICGPNSCTCCDESSSTRCQSKHDECTAPDDYCVDKSPAKCPKGFVKVSDTCFKSLSSQISVNCDCCKSLGCRPTGDQCSGPRDFCIDKEANCPTFYRESHGCHKVSASGKWIPCKCCKPLFIEWLQKKFFEGESVTTISPTTESEGDFLVCGGKGCEQGQCYYPHDGEPQSSCPRGSRVLPCICFAIGEICCSIVVT